jgi:hypothetical protein
MAGKKPKALAVMSEDELRRHVLDILGMLDASKDDQDSVMRRVRSIACKRFFSFALPNLPSALARDVEELKEAGASKEIIIAFVVHKAPDTEMAIRVLMQEVASEASDSI